MTREEALACHRKLWNEIADMIERGMKSHDIYSYKIEALKCLGEKRYLKGSCYLCEYLDNNFEEKAGGMSCKCDCPVKWKGRECENSISEYTLLKQALLYRNFAQAAFLARTIANLPERVVE